MLQNILTYIRKSLLTRRFSHCPILLTFFSVHCTSVSRSKVKGQGHETDEWPKISHIFGMGRPMNSDLVYEWSAKTSIDKRDELQAEISAWMSPLAGGGGILWRPHYRPHSLLQLFMGMGFDRNGRRSRNQKPKQGILFIIQQNAFTFVEQCFAEKTT